MKKQLTKEYLNSLFEYRDGVLYWKVARSNVIKVGAMAGGNRHHGYHAISIDGKRYYTHTLIWLMHYGFIPKEIDHIDRNPANNKIENLRVVSSSQNKLNCSLRKDSLSGVKNVGLHKKSGLWQVRIRVDGKKIHIGYYKDLELAELVATEARNKYHGEFANHG